MASDTATTLRPDDSLAKKPDEAFLLHLLYYIWRDTFIGIKANKIDAMQAVSRHKCSGMRVHERLGSPQKFKVMWWREQAMERDDSQDGSSAKYHWYLKAAWKKMFFE